jgi:hypothetical protein
MATSKNKKVNKRAKRKQQTAKKRKSNVNFSEQMKAEVQKLLTFIDTALDQLNVIDKEFKKIATENDCMDVYTTKSEEYLVYKEKLENIKTDLSAKLNNITTLEGMTELLLTFVDVSTDTVNTSQKLQSSISSIAQVENNKLVFDIPEGEKDDTTRTETTH